MTSGPPLWLRVSLTVAAVVWGAAWRHDSEGDREPALYPVQRKVLL